MEDSLRKLESTPEGLRDRWIDEVNKAEQELRKFHESAKKVNRRFLDERDAVSTRDKWFNVFYTNTNIMEASLYANIPTAEVSRKFLDANDDVARVAGNILQRCIQQDMSKPDCDFDQVMRHCVQDRLIPGLGTAWLRLETETEEQKDSYTGETLYADDDYDKETPLTRISDQCIYIDYTFWEDFLWSPCRVWSERRWIGRRVPMTRDALVKRFGEEKGRQVPLDYESKPVTDQSTPKHFVLKRACVYEIWDCEGRKVIWLSKGMPELLEIKDDPLGLDDFEPCPKPLFANITTSNCTPKPDYAMIQDQYSELDEVNNRISLLIRACKVVGVYDKSAEGVQRMLIEGSDNVLIPVDNWSMFAEKGGIKGQVDWLPLEVVVSALGQLQAHREAVKAQIYELTGISDIVRGASKASETLGAQELKSKFASVRIQKLQDEITRFAEGILRIKAEILCKHFDPLVLAKMANVGGMTPEDQQLVPAALALIKQDEELQWRVTIQSDAMAQVDYTQQKTERTEFLNATATFLQSAATVGQNSPDLIPMMAELLKFGVAGFRVGQDVEGVIDAAINSMKEQLAQAKANPQPSPEQMKAQAEQQKMQAEQQMKQQDAALKQQEQQANFALKQQSAQADLAIKQQEMVMANRQFQQEMQQEQMRFLQEMRQMQQEFGLKLELQRTESAIKQQQMQEKPKNEIP